MRRGEIAATRLGLTRPVGGWQYQELAGTDELPESLAKPVLPGVPGNRKLRTARG